MLSAMAMKFEPRPERRMARFFMKGKSKVRSQIEEVKSHGIRAIILLNCLLTSAI